MERAKDNTLYQGRGIIQLVSRAKERRAPALKSRTAGTTLSTNIQSCRCLALCRPNLWLI